MEGTPDDAVRSEALATIEFETMLLGRHLAPIRRYSDGEDRLERSAYTLLSRLELDGPQSIGQLSEIFGLDASTLNRQTAAMMRAGLLERISDPDGGMARKFRPTEEGRRRLARDRRMNIEGLGRIVADWPPDQVRTLGRLLRQLNHDIERNHEHPWPRR